MKKITVPFLIILFIIIVVVWVGVYKFNYLSGQPGYDVDGNVISSSETNEL